MPHGRISFETVINTLSMFFFFFFLAFRRVALEERATIQNINSPEVYGMEDLLGHVLLWIVYKSVFTCVERGDERRWLTLLVSVIRGLWVIIWWPQLAMLYLRSYDIWKMGVLWIVMLSILWVEACGVQDQTWLSLSWALSISTHHCQEWYKWQ